MKNKIIKWLGGFTAAELYEAVTKEKTTADKQGYKRGFNEGYQKGKARLQKSPGWFRDQIHKKLNFVFGTDKYGKNAQFRWLRQHTRRSSHMSEMNMDELRELNALLDEMIPKEN